jgi:hypothetical protein
MRLPKWEKNLTTEFHGVFAQSFTEFTGECWLIFSLIVIAVFIAVIQSSVVYAG